MSLTGIILAGGKSSRMGQDKGLLPFRGQPLVSYAINALTPMVDELMIIANNPVYESFGLQVYSDLYPDRGPLGGICTGLEYTKSKYSIVLSCDTPFVSTRLLNFLIEQAGDAQLAIASEKGKYQPLVGRYASSLKPRLTELLNEGNLRMGYVMDELRPRLVNIHDDLAFYSPFLFFNVNRRQDLEAGGS